MMQGLGFFFLLAQERPWVGLGPRALGKRRKLLGVEVRSQAIWLGNS